MNHDLIPLLYGFAAGSVLTGLVCIAMALLMHEKSTRRMAVIAYHHGVAAGRREEREEMEARAESNEYVVAVRRPHIERCTHGRHLGEICPHCGSLDRQRANIRALSRCPNDTNGDGDCDLCVRSGGCKWTETGEAKG